MSDTGGLPTNTLADPQTQRATFTFDLARKPVSPVRRQGREKRAVRARQALVSDISKFFYTTVSRFLPSASRTRRFT